MGVAALSRTQRSAAFLLQRKMPGCERLREADSARRPRGERWHATPVGLRVRQRKAPGGDKVVRGGTAQGAGLLREGNSTRR
eukprot:383383-Pleurochrysis_carterae.AAC.1